MVEVREALRPHVHAVRWVGDESLHMTVKFLGSARPERLDALRLALTEALVSLVPATARSVGVTAFPSVANPRVICALLEADGLVHLAAEVDRIAAHLGFPAETRPFRPHVTLGRVKDAAPPTNLTMYLNNLIDTNHERLTANEISLFRSDLHPAGAIYTKLWSVPFRGAPTR